MDTEDIKAAAKNEEAYRMYVLAILSDISSTLDRVERRIELGVKGVEISVQASAAATSVLLQQRTEKSASEIISEVDWMRNKLFGGG